MRSNEEARSKNSIAEQTIAEGEAIHPRELYIYNQTVRTRQVRISQGALGRFIDLTGVIVRTQLRQIRLKRCTRSRNYAAGRRFSNAGWPARYYLMV